MNLPFMFQATFFRGTAISVAIATLLAACAAPSGPQAPAPATAPVAFKEAATHLAPINETTVPVAAKWWTVFNDPVLDTLEDQLVIGNENLKLIVAQVASARAVLTGSQRATQPSLSAGLNGTRSVSASSTNGSASPVDAVSLTASASWEPDLWGRLALTTRNAESSLKASEADLASARLSAQSTLAQTYFSLRSAERQQALLERSVSAYQRTLELTQVRYDGGLAQRTDVLQAQSQLESARTQLAESAAQRAQYEHAIAVLLGKAPSQLDIQRTEKLPVLPEVPEIIPGELLERRPDISAALWRVKAAYAQIGVTDAAWYPTVALSATAGYSQSSLANLLSTPNLIWSLGAAVSQSIFDSGAHAQASEQARASAEQATASYRGLVLTSLQEVEDNLVLARRLADEVVSQTAAWQASTRTLELVLAQYKAGTVSYLNVTAAQSAALSSEITLIGVQTRALTASSNLLKNLAGRWTDNTP